MEIGDYDISLNSSGEYLVKYNYAPGKFIVKKFRPYTVILVLNFIFNLADELEEGKVK